MRHFTGRLYHSNSGVKPGDDYLFLGNDGEKNSFSFHLRQVYRFALPSVRNSCKHLKVTRFRWVPIFPLVWLNYGRGSGFMEGEYNYTRIEAGILQTFTTKSLGRTSVMIEGGLVDGDVPFQKLYNGRGSYWDFSLEAANSFATMRMTEFALMNLLQSFSGRISKACFSGAAISGRSWYLLPMLLSAGCQNRKIT
jgi:hypothetical protein